MFYCVENLGSSAFLFRGRGVLHYDFPPRSLREDILSVNFATRSKNEVLVYIGSAKLQKPKDFLRLAIVRLCGFACFAESYPEWVLQHGVRTFSSC